MIAVVFMSILLIVVDIVSWIREVILKRVEILWDQPRNAGDGEEDVEEVGRHLNCWLDWSVLSSVIQLLFCSQK